MKKRKVKLKMNEQTMYLRPTKLISPPAKHLLKIGKLYKITSIRLFADEYTTSFSVGIITDNCIQYFSNRQLEGIIYGDLGCITLANIFD